MRKTLFFDLSSFVGQLRAKMNVTRLISTVRDIMTSILNFDDFIIALIISFAPLWIQVRMRETCKRIRAIIDHEIVCEYRDPIFEQSRGFAPDDISRIGMRKCLVAQSNFREIYATIHRANRMWRKSKYDDLQLVVAYFAYMHPRDMWTIGDISVVCRALLSQDDAYLARNQEIMKSLQIYATIANCREVARFLLSFKKGFVLHSCRSDLTSDTLTEAKYIGKYRKWNFSRIDKCQLLGLGFAAKYGRFAQYIQDMPDTHIRTYGTPKLLARMYDVSGAHQDIADLVSRYCREWLKNRHGSKLVGCARYLASYGYFDFADSISEILRLQGVEVRLPTFSNAYKTFIQHARNMCPADYDRYLQFTSDCAYRELFQLILARHKKHTVCHGNYFEMIRAMVRRFGREKMMEARNLAIAHLSGVRRNERHSANCARFARSILLNYLSVYVNMTQH